MVSTMTKVEAMKIPAGYKQTEVGVIPEDWSILALSALCSLKSGETITSASFEDGAIYPCYGGNGLRGYTKTFNHNGEYALIGRQGALCGNIQYVNDKFFASEHALVATPSKITDVKWLAIYLEQMNLNQYSESSAQPGLSAVKLSVLKLIAPNKKEQTAIANALSDVDNLIAALETLIAKKSAIKTAAMQQLLTGKKRLPAFAGEREGQHLKANEQCTAKPNEQHRTQPNSASDTPPQHHSDAENNQHTPRPGYKHTELGEIPEDWEVKSLGASLTIMHGKDQKQVECADGKYPILGTGGEMGRTDSYLYDKPSVLIGRKGSINKPRYMDSPFWTVDTLFYSQVSEKFNAKFIYYKFCMIDWMSYNEASGVPSLNSSTIESVVQVFPQTKAEQTAIANVLSEMDTELDALQQRLAKTQAIKQGMMQELLTGKTRLV